MPGLPPLWATGGARVIPDPDRDPAAPRTGAPPAPCARMSPRAWLAVGCPGAVWDHLSPAVQALLRRLPRLARLSAEAWAHDAGLSARALSRRVREALGMTTRQVVVSFRVETGRWLATLGRSQPAIAASVGYSQPAAYRRARNAMLAAPG
mgnify:CR=1 FL=1